jgi:hypothetical protein
MQAIGIIVAVHEPERALNVNCLAETNARKHFSRGVLTATDSRAGLEFVDGHRLIGSAPL